MTKDPTDILDKLPKKTPVWAVGIISLTVSLTVSLIAAYLVARPEIQTYMTASTSLAESRFQSEAGNMNSLFSLIKDHSSQITTLSEALARTQSSNMELVSKVAILEKDVGILKRDVQMCEKALGDCKSLKRG